MTEIALLHTRLQHAIETDRPAAIEKTLGEIFQIDPDDRVGHLTAATVLRDAEKYDEAMAHVSAALEQWPYDIDARMIAAQIEIDRKNFPVAERILLEVLEDEPEFAGAFSYYAWVMFQTMFFEKAEALCHEALRLDEQMNMPRTILLLIDLAFKRSSDAEERLSNLIAENPEALHTAWIAVTVLASQSRDREALEIVQCIIRQDPSDTDAIDAAVELRVRTHWATIPCRPFFKYGTLATGIMWAIAITVFFLMRTYGMSSFATALAGIYLFYVIYTWLFPRMLAGDLRRRGI